MGSKTNYIPKEGDLVCLLHEGWEYCGFGTVIEVLNGARMCQVYWHDMKKSFYEYADELLLYDDVDLKKCRKFIGNRRKLLDFYDL